MTTTSEHYSSAYIAKWITHHPWLSILVATFLLALSLGGVSGYQYSVDHRAFFSSDNPQLQAYELLQNDYSRTDTILIVLAPSSGEVFDTQFLRTLHKLTEDAWQVPYTQRVESLTNFQHTRVDGDFIETDNLVDASQALTDQDLAALRQIATSEPFLVNALVNHAASVTGVRLTLNLPGHDPLVETPAVVLPIRELAQEIRNNHPNIDVHLAGQIIANQVYPEESQADIVRVWPWFILTMLIMLSWLFRSIKAMIVTWSACLLAVFAGVGAIGYLSPVINDAVIVAPIMILTLAIADGIHLVVGWNQGLMAGQSKRDAMADSLTRNIGPMTLTTLLTALGFLTLHFNDSPPFRVMGYIVAAGVLFALFFTLLFTAPLLVLLPGKGPRRLSPLATANSLPMLQLANFVIRKKTPLLGIFIVLGSLLAGLSLRNVINDDIVKYYTPETPFRTSMEFVNSELTGIGEINFALPAGAADNISDPDYLRRIETFSDWLKTQPDVIQVNSIVDILKRINQVLHDNDPAWYRLPESREEAAQYLLQYELSLSYGMDLNWLIRHDRAETRVRVSVGTSSGQRIIALNEAAKQWQKDNWEPQWQTPGASLSLMFAHIGERSIAGMFGGMLGALVIASLLLMIGFMTWQHGLAGFIANLLPIGMAFGVWFLLNGNIDLGLTVVIGIAFAVVVDDTVHFICQYEHARRNGCNPEAAIRATFLRVGFALITTSLVLAFGFAWLANSAIQISVNTAVVTCLAIAFALLVDLLLLPALLLVTDRRSLIQKPISPSSTLDSSHS